MKKIIFFYLKKLWHQAANDNNLLLMQSVEKTKSAVVLDIGVFRGELILDRVQNIKKPKIYAVDINEDVIKSCKKLGIKAIKHDIEKGLPFKSNFFDVVIANQIIEHLVDIDLFISEIYRVLKPKGYLLLSTENLSSWHNLFALTLGWQAFSQHLSKKGSIGNPLRLVDTTHLLPHDMHIKIFTLKGLVELVQIYNFRVEKTFGSGYYPLPNSIAKIFSEIDQIHSVFIGFKASKK